MHDEQSGSNASDKHFVRTRDGQPIYLAETNPGKKAFRLWRCPQCDSTRTNEENLLNEMA